MKNFILLLCILGMGNIALAQWTTSVNGSDIYSSNPGKVGIGNSSPGSLLSIGSSSIRGTIDVSGNTTEPPYLNLTDARTGGRTYSIYSGLSGTGKLEIFDQSASAYRLVINSSGNIGIGTTDPQGYKLAVNGHIRAKEIKIDTDWADFVFEPDYKLLSLKETEDYIKKNKRLPEIPSAKEVEKDGINVGEMNAKLLRKIEELTLHLIEQNKSSEAQNLKLNQQDQQIEFLTKQLSGIQREIKK